VRAARARRLQPRVSPTRKPRLSNGGSTVADISVERKPRSPLGLILAIVLLAAIAGGVWWYMSQNAHRPVVDAPGTPAPPATANP